MRDHRTTRPKPSASGVTTPGAGAAERREAAAREEPALQGDAGKNRALVRLGIAFLTCVIVAFVIWLFATGKASDLASALVRADLRWVAAGMACFVAYFLLDALCFRIAAALSGSRLGTLDLLSTAASGIVFGYLTPGQMGAQPAQIVRLVKAGLSAGDATAVQLTRFFIFQAAVTTFGAVMLVTRLSFFREMYGQVILAAVLAFLVHLAIMAGLVAVIFFPNLVRRLARMMVRIGSGRLRLVKDPEATLAMVEREVDEYATSVHAAVRHAGIVSTAVVITVAQLVSVYLIPFCVLNALGAETLDPYTCVAAAAFIQLILTAVPLPGGTGGAEGGFALFFGATLGGDLTAAIVMWRAISFYLPVIISAPVLGLRSKMSPSQLRAAYGEALLGREAVRQDISIVRDSAREHAEELRASMRHRATERPHHRLRHPRTHVRGPRWQSRHRRR